MEHHAQLLNQRLDDQHDELRDHATEIYKLKNIMAGIVAGTRLGSIEPTNGMAIAAIQTMHNIATQINRVAENNNRLEARLDVLEFINSHRPPGGISNSSANTSDNNNNR